MRDRCAEADTILARAASAEFNLCVPQPGNGDLQLSLSSDAGDQVVLNLH
jgi:hypothetical protein